MKLIGMISVFMLILGQTSLAQVYSFNKTDSPYEELTDAISINNGEVWSYPDYTIPLGFNFYLFDTLIDKVYFFDEGQGCTISSSYSTESFHKFIVPFGTGLLDRGYPSSQSLSPLSYKVVGEPGTRICKIQWKNAGFTGDYEENGFTHDYVNFQLWLYETTGLIEMHYGSSMISSFIDDFGATGPYILLSPLFDNDEYSLSPETIWLGGDPQNPDVFQSDMFYFLEGIMFTNTVYQFNNNLTTKTNGIKEHKYNLSPNPAKDFIYIDLNTVKEKTSVQVLDLSGIILQKSSYYNCSKFPAISIQALLPGIYIIQIQTNKGTYNEKFIKIL